ncbi:hypothetical protein YC2023_099108 [Brassica napus]
MIPVCLQETKTKHRLPTTRVPNGCTEALCVVHLQNVNDEQQNDEAEDRSINFGESFIDPYYVSIERQQMNLDPERVIVAKHRQSLPTAKDLFAGGSGETNHILRKEYLNYVSIYL